jgi:protein phosphatase methylesterase 1
LDLINSCEDHVDLRERVVGIIVIDVVEGTALEALPHMHLIVKNK